MMFFIILGVTPRKIAAQVYCLESAPPNFGPDPAVTLCQQYNTLGEFPNRFGTKTTYLASQIILNINNGNEIFTGNIDLIGDLIVDIDFTLLNCIVRIMPNVEIVVEPGVNFTLDGSKLFCCDQMWKGIRLEKDSKIITKSNTEIEDALVAIEAKCTARLSIANTIFNRNLVGIKLGQTGTFWDPCPSFPVFTKFSQNTFQCNAPLNHPDEITYAGIQILKTNVTIGAINSGPNKFKNIRFGIRFDSQWPGTSIINRCDFESVLTDGIFIADGNITIKNCNFTNCGFRGINSLITRGLVVEQCRFYCNDDVAGQGNFNNWNLYHHIRAAGFALNCDVNINHNNFRCNFTNQEKIEDFIGIEIIGDLTMGSLTHFQIEWNTFDFLLEQNSPTQRDCAQIQLSGEFPSTSSTNIEFNNFTLDQPNFQLGQSNQVIGINVLNGSKNNLSIYSNTFESEAIGPLADPTHESAIRLLGSVGSGNIVSGNVIRYNPSTGFSVDFLYGLRVGDFTNTLYCQNTLRESSYPTIFRGTCMGTTYYANTVVGGGNWLRISAGFIGEQGVEEGESNSNKWYEKWTNIITTVHAYCTVPNLAPLSRFWVHTPQSIRQNNPPIYTYFSEYHPAVIDPDQSDEWFKYSLECEPGALDCIDHISVDKSDQVIANYSLDTLVEDPAFLYTAKYYLYSKLLQNPEILSEFQEFPSFVATESTSTVGKFYEVNQLILEGLSETLGIVDDLEQLKEEEEELKSNLLIADSILNSPTTTSIYASALSSKFTSLLQLHLLDSLYSEYAKNYQENLSSKLEDALNLNNQIVTSHTHEEYEKNVNEISILRALAQGGTLSAFQIATLQDIASECPKVGGHSVYRARGLLYDCNAGGWNDNTENCFPEPEIVRPVILDTLQGRTTPKQFFSLFSVYPNPSKDGFYVKLPSNEGGKITILDSFGKVWRLLDLRGSEDYVEMREAPAGVYICKITTSNGDRYITKVFLNK